MSDLPLYGHPVFSIFIAISIHSGSHFSHSFLFWYRQSTFITIINMKLSTIAAGALLAVPSLGAPTSYFTELAKRQGNIDTTILQFALTVRSKQRSWKYW